MTQTDNAKLLKAFPQRLNLRHDIATDLTLEQHVGEIIDGYKVLLRLDSIPMPFSAHSDEAHEILEAWAAMTRPHLTSSPLIEKLDDLVRAAKGKRKVIGEYQESTSEASADNSTGIGQSDTLQLTATKEDSRD